MVYFSRPNGDVKLRSLFDDGERESEESVMTADEWIAQRAMRRRTANFEGKESFERSRGTEHLRDRKGATLDRPAKVVEAV